MTSIWVNDHDGWRLLAPIGFPLEAELHDLVAGAPQLLPLAGTPRVAVVGREVRIGTGYADLVAVEPTGRLVLIEVKLAANAEARRAVVAQILAYAAHLKGIDVLELERDLLAATLQGRGVTRLVDLAVQDFDEVGLDAESFETGLADSLTAGRFRLVLVLDDAPPELVKLVGYLESIAPELVIDLVTVTAYDVNGSRVLVPQRVDPERMSQELRPTTAAAAKGGQWTTLDDFDSVTARLPSEQQELVRRAVRWAEELERHGLLRVRVWRGAGGRATVLPYLPNEDVGLVTIWNESGLALSLWRSVFERRARRASRWWKKRSRRPESARATRSRRSATSSLRR